MDDRWEKIEKPNQSNGQSNGQSTGQSNGLFLFFVIGLFVLQTIFAFRIHGDIGPAVASSKSVDRPASPLLIGRIETLVDGSSQVLGKKATSEPSKTFPRKNFANSKILSKIPAPQKKTVNVSPNIQDTGKRFLEYKISKGDTLRTISKKIFGNTRMVPALVRINRVTDPGNLQCGSSLLIPRISAVLNQNL
ncbi:LysM peptidoglycan-binding domain-containing protein [bacterium]|nr:LysM peptidoglycan-binding domain-containing protein [bacterium]